LRGKGISGKEASKTADKNKAFLNSPFFAAILSAYSVVLALYILMRKRRLPTSLFGRLVDSDLHSDDQNEVIAYLFNIHGCPDIAEDYLKRHRVPSYWSEADHIAAVAIKEIDADMKEKRKQILIDLLNYAGIAPVSQGIIHYNIARISKHQGKLEESQEHLTKAAKLIPRLLKKRLDLDPIFKVSGQQLT
jgi:hypothetical protein